MPDPATLPPGALPALSAIAASLLTAAAGVLSTRAQVRSAADKVMAEQKPRMIEIAEQAARNMIDAQAAELSRLREQLTRAERRILDLQDELDRSRDRRHDLANELMKLSAQVDEDRRQHERQIDAFAVRERQLEAELHEARAAAETLRMRLEAAGVVLAGATPTEGDPT